jgi:hypothetical protein
VKISDSSEATQSPLSRALFKLFILEYDVDFTGYYKSGRSIASTPKLL